MQKTFLPAYRVVGELFASRRRAAGVSQRLLSQRLQVSQSTVSKVERGVQHLDVLEISRWLAAVGGPSLSEFIAAVERQLESTQPRNVPWSVSAAAPALDENAAPQPAQQDAAQG